MYRIIAFLFLSLYFQISIARDFNYDGIIYTVVSEDKKTCKTKDGNDTSFIPGNEVNGEVIIPENVMCGDEKFTVTAIGENAFCWTGITEITLPPTITEIGYRAFWRCECLSSINIPNSVVTIGSGAFLECFSLNNIEIPASVKEIGAAAFAGCADLTNISLSNSITEIARSTFSSCSSLIQVSIPKSVIYIGDEAFSSCSGLISISIPNSVKEIGNRTFYGCTRLNNIVLPNSVESLGCYAFAWAPLTTITVPPSVNNLEWAFLECYTLQEILVDDANPYFRSEAGVLFNKEMTEIIQYPFSREVSEYAIPASVETIGYRAFYNCCLLTNILIPNSVRRIREWALGDCTGLTNINIPNTVDVIDNAAFAGCTGLISITLPKNLQNISGDAFSRCNKLTDISIDDENLFFSSQSGVLFNKKMTEIIRYPTGRSGEYTIPNTVNKINYCAFDDCSGLTSITIPNTVSTIGNMAFARCSGLKSISFPNSVISIDAAAFLNCNRLESITLGNSVKTIGSLAFYQCENIIKVTSLNPEPPELILIPPKDPSEDPENDVFSPSVFESAQLFVPVGAENAYWASLGWKDFKTISATSGLEDITLININDIPVVYYDLQGVQISNPSKGFYIVRRGAVINKEYIR